MSADSNPITGSKSAGVEATIASMNEAASMFAVMSLDRDGASLLSAVSASDNSDILSALVDFSQTVEFVQPEEHDGRPVEGAQIIYQSKAIAAKDMGVQAMKWGIGPLEFSMQFNKAALTVVFIVHIRIPFKGPVKVGSAAGSLRDGVSLKIGYDKILSGEVGVKYDNGIYLWYTFTAFGVPHHGRKTIKL